MRGIPIAQAEDSTPGKRSRGGEQLIYATTFCVETMLDSGGKWLLSHLLA